MIPIVKQNGNCLIWNASDWLKAREEHRIVGSLRGCLVGLPRQESLQGLPLALLPEEVTLLLEENLAYVISDSALSQPPNEQTREKYLTYKETNKKEQISCYEEQRKQQVTSMIDRIIEGKRRKLMGVSTKKKKGQVGNSKEEKEVPKPEVELDREEILKTELERSAASATHPLLVQTFTSEQWLNETEVNKADWDFPSTSFEKLKYSVYKDLWKKGSYITSGHKFGVDYLVYPGDPVKFHAQYLVVCMEYNNNLATEDFIAYARLGSISRKTFVIASQCPKTLDILYQSVQWNDKNSVFS